MSQQNKLICQLNNVGKTFRVGTQNVPVLKNITFEIKKGDFMLIFGPSGSGKSTLLHVMIGLEPPTNGEIIFLNELIYEYSEDERAEFRKDNIGMVYQQSHWLQALNVIENVAFPWLLQGKDHVFAKEKAKEKLSLLSMMNWADYLPSELSSGQQQRVSLARALVTDPDIIIADEPTGNLDHESSQSLVKELANLSGQGKTVIMVSHDLGNLSFAKSAIKLMNGAIQKQYQKAKDSDLLHQVIGDGTAYQF